jgi:hypothetical protein
MASLFHGFPWVFCSSDRSLQEIHVPTSRCFFESSRKNTTHSTKSSPDLAELKILLTPPPPREILLRRNAESHSQLQPLLQLERLLHTQLKAIDGLIQIICADAQKLAMLDQAKSGDNSQKAKLPTHRKQSVPAGLEAQFPISAGFSCCRPEASSGLRAIPRKFTESQKGS